MTTGRFRSTTRALLLLGLLAVSCGSRVGGGATLVPTSTPSSTPWPSLLAIAQTMTANSTYLQECELDYPASVTGRLQYAGIMPGTTKAEELQGLIGAPKEVRGEGQIEQIFEGFTVTLEGDLVDSVLVVREQELYGSLQEVLLGLGCPELVLATSTAEDGYPLAYDGTQLVYLRLGLLFAFDQHPVSLDAMPVYAEYFAPASLMDYLEWAHLDRGPATRQRPVDWDAAIR